VAAELERMMSDELPLIRDHFDNQLTVLKSLLEATNAKAESNHLQQMVAINEVKSDVKSQGHRVTLLEINMARIEGKNEGSRTSTNLIITILGLVAGSGATILAVTMAGR
jgi:hypothetical protein